MGSLGFKYSRVKGQWRVGEQKIRIFEITPDKPIKKHHQHSNIALIDVTVFFKCICL